MGALAIGATLVGAIVATIDGIIVCCINARKQNQRIRDCCSKLGKAIKDGELLLCSLPYISPISRGGVLQNVSLSDFLHRIQASTTKLTKHTLGKVVKMYSIHIYSHCNCSNLIGATVNYNRHKQLNLAPGDAH